MSPNGDTVTIGLTIIFFKTKLFGCKSRSRRLDAYRPNLNRSHDSEGVLRASKGIDSEGFVIDSTNTKCRKRYSKVVGAEEVFDVHVFEIMKNLLTLVPNRTFSRTAEKANTLAKRGTG